jgi:hypothetical protein
LVFSTVGILGFFVTLTRVDGFNDELVAAGVVACEGKRLRTIDGEVGFKRFNTPALTFVMAASSVIGSASFGSSRVSTLEECSARIKIVRVKR